MIFCGFLLFSCSVKTADKNNADTNNGNEREDYITDPHLKIFLKYVKDYEPRQKHIQRYADFSVQKDDSRYCWFSIHALDSFIHKIESEGADGIRFYYSVYPKDTGNENGSFNYKYENHHTLVLVATKDSTIGGEEIAFDLAVPDAFRKDVFSFFVLPPPVMNHGQLCPPGYCTGATFMYANVK